MVHEVLIAQIGQRFLHEKRARVCLWFDPSREFARLLPGLQAELAQMSTQPFTLLEYAASSFHGQVWLKHRVHSELAGLDKEERKRRRFVIYLPVSEDRLDAPDELGEHHLELLEEYRTAGLIWRVGGKRPTLFRFLRQAGVKLPASPSDQRRLYEGGFDSVLAKYVAKFATRPAAYWDDELTPVLAQTRLLGDVDETLIELAIDPPGKWHDLKDKGLAPEFLAAVIEKYGFSHPTDSPDAWLRAFVATVALTETFQSYDEPADFPFVDRLPPLAQRPRFSELLRRWLRDSEGRSAWDHWVREVEKDIDLSAWLARSQEERVNGLSFAFPHVVRVRWERALAALRDAAPKTSATEIYFDEGLDRIRLEAEYSRASERPIGAWSLLAALGDFLEACRRGEHAVSGAEGASALVQVYVRNAAAIDQAHILLRREAEERGIPCVTAIADRHYASYTKALNGRFFKDYVSQGDSKIAGLPEVTEKLEQGLWTGQSRRAVLIIDALRYDCALAIANELQGFDVVVEPMRAELPTITPVGMTALMPLSSATVTLDIRGNNVLPRVNGKDCAQRKHRLALMAGFGADCRDIEDLESVSAPPDPLGELLVVFGHDQVDHIGHGSGDNLVRHVGLEIQRIARLVRKLHSWGYEGVHVVTDHGFILLEESKLPDEVVCDKDWCHVRKERFALIPATADVPLASFPTTWDPSMRVALPPGLAFFKAEKSFSHGGAALQELVIPHLVSKNRTREKRRVGVEVVLPSSELTQASVKIVLRPETIPQAASGQMSLFKETGRTLVFDVRRSEDPSSTVLARRRAKKIRIEPGDTEKSVTVFFHTAESFSKGERLDLDIRDAETGEQFPPGGIQLSVGRDI